MEAAIQMSVLGLVVCASEREILGTGRQPSESCLLNFLKSAILPLRDNSSPHLFSSPFSVVQSLSRFVSLPYS